MIRNKYFKPKYIYSFLLALILHAAIFAYVKGDLHNIEFLTHLSNETRTLKKPLKIDQIELIKKEEVEKLRKVGIKDGVKNLNRPDLPSQPSSQSQLPRNPDLKNLSLSNLAPQLEASPKIQNNLPARTVLTPTPSKENDHFYFKYNDQKIIPKSTEQENLKLEATKNLSAPRNKATERISNFEIRYERPEGVSEDELNSDEKAYYSFYVRSYKNYFAKIYSNYEKIIIERPGLAKVFDKKHLLIGKIDYDENGNIITVRILKSSESDDLHYFFEETLKELNQPNPPKVFTKNRKQFSIFYQIQIN